MASIGGTEWRYIDTRDGEVTQYVAAGRHHSRRGVIQHAGALYPQAEIVTFEGGGHAIALLHQEEYFAAIDAFLADSE